MSKRVLIVDDSRISRNFIEKVFIEIGYEVVGKAIDGIDGLEQCKELNPNLITVDIEMPNLDGMGMVKYIRNHKNNVDIIVISSIVNSRIIQEAVKHGASVIKKPIKKEMLINAIELLQKQ